MMKISCKGYLLWSAIWITFFLLLLFLFANIDLVHGEVRTNLEESKSTTAILMNNTYHFFLYLVFFPFSLLLTFFEFFLLALHISIGFQSMGVKETVSLLFPHALLEFPNILFYTYLSFHSLKELIKDFRVLTVFKTLYANRFYYIGSYAVLVLAAIVEGGIG